MHVFKAQMVIRDLVFKCSQRKFYLAVAARDEVAVFSYVFDPVTFFSISFFYISCSRLYRLLFMYKICRFLSVKFEFPITFFLLDRFT